MSSSWQVRIVAVLFGIPILPLAAAPVPGAAPEVQAAVELAAARLPFFHPFEFGYGLMPPEQAAAYERGLAPIRGKNFKPEDLVALLGHESPPVRTLAAALLFARMEPKYLPHLVPLASDKNYTLPRPANLAARPMGMRPVPLLQQTVGEVVGCMIHDYLILAGDYGIEPVFGRPGFDAYWAKRKDRTDCASWIYVRLRPFALGGATRTAKERLDKLPETDRAFTTLWIAGAPGQEGFATEAELVALCKKLGPAALVKMLQRKIPCDDPDLDGHTSNPQFYNHMMMFVLKHARELLRPEDADALLACAKAEEEGKDRLRDPLMNPIWFKAISDLKPPSGRIFLEQRWPAYQEAEAELYGKLRTDAAVAEVRGTAEDATAFVTKWFYNEEPVRGPLRGRQVPGREAFLYALRVDPKPGDRKIISTLVADKRLDTLDWVSLVELIRLANVGRDRPIVSEEELDRQSHPLGIAAYRFERERARKEFPKETEQLEATLARWRTALRTNVP
jgi:hypothetical protein